MSNSIEDSFICPITQEVMREPVICIGDGHSYEKAAIQAWFHKSGNHTSPLTGRELAGTELELVPNFALRSAIEASQQACGTSNAAVSTIPETTLFSFGTDDNKSASSNSNSTPTKRALPKSSTFAPGCPQIITAGSQGLYTGMAEIQVWDTNKWRQTLRLTDNIHDGAITCLAAFQSSPLLASGSRDKTIKVWSTTEWTSTITLQGHTDWVYCCGTGPSERLLVSGSRDCSLRVWDLEVGQARMKLAGHCGYVYCCAVDPRGNQIVSGSEDWTARVWDIDSGQCVQTLEGHNNAVMACAGWGDREVVATGGADRLVRMWDPSSWGSVATLQGHEEAVTCVALDPRGSWLVSGSRDCTLRVW
eukprot:CAMPEP_0118940546 /NCGR_PEP_ID=MMETSP1169-20130426/31720_1 /TAXON_ID=36882 /ORGANISM="Pyramimonas obovata, Strain CCMP722" /LENGTH=361 /DNA_ID=CAMNT_0006885067 /DNA_START=143 /DNA_END=1225 /DNA_ORIENTATION=+